MKCTKCGGSGIDLERRPCPTCNGTGKEPWKPEEAHKPDADLLLLHPCPCDKECPCDRLKAWVSVDKRLRPPRLTDEEIEDRAVAGYEDSDILERVARAAARRTIALVKEREGL